jgi:hypothetical protein
MSMNPEFMVRRVTKYEFELHVEVLQNHRTYLLGRVRQRQ